MKNTKVINKQPSTNGNFIEYHLLGLDDSDFFDSLVSFFRKNYHAEVETFTDGISTRTWQLRVNNEYIKLEHHDDIDNWFYSCEPSGDSILMHEIAADLEERLKNIPYN